jgi:hypothetical protein
MKLCKEKSRLASPKSRINAPGEAFLIYAFVIAFPMRGGPALKMKLPAASCRVFRRRRINSAVFQSLEYGAINPSALPSAAQFCSRGAIWPDTTVDSMLF